MVLLRPTFVNVIGSKTIFPYLSQFTPRNGVREESMRKSLISSSVSTVVAQANDRLVAAGMSVLRTLLSLTFEQTSKREPHTGWLEPNVAHGNRHFLVAEKPWSNPRWFQRRAYALCPAYAAIARVAD